MRLLELQGAIRLACLSLSWVGASPTPSYVEALAVACSGNLKSIRGSLYLQFSDSSLLVRSSCNKVTNSGRK